MAADRESVSEARALLKRGDFLSAFDRARASIEDGLVDADAIRIATLSLARSGATEHAFRFLEEHGAHLPEDEETGALRARLLKDRFKACRDPSEKAKQGRCARDAYLEVFRRTNGYFPGINAATLSALIGDEATRRELASEVLALVQTQAETDYWARATMAEACFLLGREEEAAEQLGCAAAEAQDDFAARSTTYHQLAMLCNFLGTTREILDPIRVPTFIHFTGARIGGAGERLAIGDPATEKLRAEIRQVLAANGVGFAYGSMMSVPDLLVTEEVLAAGVELHATLPFSFDELLRLPAWRTGLAPRERLERALGMARSVTHVAEDVHSDLHLMCRTASLQAAGLARLRSEALGARLMQVCIRSEAPGDEEDAVAGIASRLGIGSHRIELAASSSAQAEEPEGAGDHREAVPREVKTMIFADVKGFSTLPECQIPPFVHDWLELVADLVKQHEGDVAHVATWGDAAYFVMDSVSSAASVALDLAGCRLRGGDHGNRGMHPHTLGVRVSAHVGPVFVVADPVLNRNNYYGPDITKTARMEPCTPEGEVFVSEAFAAHLALEAHDVYRCEYAGEQQLAKGYGVLRMYHLSSR